MSGTIVRPGPRRSAFTLLILLLAWDLAAEEQWGLEMLVQRLGAGGHPPLHYTETRESAFLQVPLVSHGTLHVLQDGSLVKEKHVPRFERITIGRERIDVESANGGKRSFALSELPGAAGFAIGLLALFAGDLTALHEQFATELDGGPDNWRLLLSPVDERLTVSIQYILLTGGVTKIRRIRIVEGDGDSTLLELEILTQ